MMVSEAEGQRGDPWDEATFRLDVSSVKQRVGPVGMEG
jgi:hypothetical protein